MPIVRTPIVDDDGSLTVGTVFENAWKVELYNQIDAAIAAAVSAAAGDLNAPFVNLAPTTTFTTFEGAAVTVTQIFHRYKRLVRLPGPPVVDLIYWEAAINPMTLPAATAVVQVKQLPFALATASSHMPVARTSGGAAFANFGGASIVNFQRMDGVNWASGAGFLFWAAVVAANVA